jgi:hypothetical protein
MCSVTVGQQDQIRPVKVDASKVNMIGILSSMNAASSKPYLSLVNVDAVDAAYDPWALSDL